MYEILMTTRLSLYDNRLTAKGFRDIKYQFYYEKHIITHPHICNFIACGCIVFVLFGCSGVESDEWACINYNAIVCNKDNANAVGCKYDAEALSNVGRSGKK